MISFETYQKIQYVNGVAQSDMRYKNAHYRWVLKLSKHFPLDDLEEAMEHCIKEKRYNTHELIAFLIYRQGNAKIKNLIAGHMYYQCRDRAAELAKEAEACPTSEK